MVNIKRSNCLFCSLGCGLAFRIEGNGITAIDYDKADPVTQGSLCPRGYYNLELLNHPERLDTPRIGDRKASWQEAIEFAKRGLSEFGGEAAGIVVSCLSSNEDAYMAAKLSAAIGTKNIVAFGSPADIEASRGGRAEKNIIEEIANVETLIIIGDLLTRSAVMAKYVNKVKYGKRGNKIIVIDPNNSHTTWFATNHFKNKPGTEVLVIAGMLSPEAIEPQLFLQKTGIALEAIKSIAEDFSKAGSGAILFAPSQNIQKNDVVSRLISELASKSTGKKSMVFYEHGNTGGICSILDNEVPDHTSYDEMLDKFNREEIKTLLMLGDDFSCSHPELEKKIRRLKFVAASSYFIIPWADRTTVTFPLASHIEEGGSFVLADGNEKSLEAIAPKVGGKSNAEISSLLMDTQYDKEKVACETKNAVRKRGNRSQKDISEIIKEATIIEPSQEADTENITHFGNNSLVSKFFWYRANNQ